MGKANTTDQGHNNSGRRRTRHDRQVLVTAFEGSSEASKGDSLVKTIKLGQVEAAILLDLIVLYEPTQKPIGQPARDEIVARHSKSPGAVMMNVLVKKGALRIDGEGTERDKDCFPVLQDVVYIDSRARRQIWPKLDKVPPAPTSTVSAKGRVAVSELVLTLITAAFALNPRPRRASELYQILKDGGVKSAPFHVMALDKAGRFRVVSGTHGSRKDPPMRVLVEPSEGAMSTSFHSSETSVRAPKSKEELRQRAQQLEDEIATAVEEHLARTVEPLAFELRALEEEEVRIRERLTKIGERRVSLSSEIEGLRAGDALNSIPQVVELRARLKRICQVIDLYDEIICEL